MKTTWEKVRSHPNSVYAPPPPKRRVLIVVVVLALALFGILLVGNNAGSTAGHNHWNLQISKARYDYTYPLSEPEEHEGYISYHIGLISDPDTASKQSSGKSWASQLYFGELRAYGDGQYAFQMEDGAVTLETALNAKGRGAELSELIAFNGKLYAADDRTGILFELIDYEENKPVLVPRAILSNGDGRQAKGQKSEWMTVKDGQLWVGGLGRDWTTEQGDYINSYPKWVKVVSMSGAVHHLDWTIVYNKLKEACGLPDIGYLWHEAVIWDSENSKWYFLPRRASALKYDDKEDEHRGTNLLIEANEDFSDIHVHTIGEIIPERGYSSFKVIPNTDGKHALAVKSEEVDGTLKSYITVFSLETQKVLLEDMLIADDKIEGVEFI